MIVDGYTVFDFVPDFENAPEMRPMNTVDRAQFNIGQGMGAFPDLRQRMQFTFTYRLTSKTQIDAFQRAFNDARGRGGAVWLPSWHNEFALYGLADANSIFIYPVDYPETYFNVANPNQAPGVNIFLADHAGAVYPARVSGCATEEAGISDSTVVDKLAVTFLNTTPPTSFNQHDYICGCLYLARFANDVLSFKFTAEDECEVSVGFYELLVDVPNPSNGIWDAGINNRGIATLELTPDGKVVIMGNFDTVAGVSMPYLARLNKDASLDTTFDTLGKVPGGMYDSRFRALKVDTLGNVYFANTYGYTTTPIDVGGSWYRYLCKLDPLANLIWVADYADQGITRNISFWNSDIVISTDGGGNSSDALIQTRAFVFDQSTDGSDSGLSYTPLYTQSGFAGLNGGNQLLIAESTLFTSTSRIALLNSDLSLDTSFAPSSQFAGFAPQFPTQCMLIQKNGKFLLWGQFTSWNGYTTRGFISINPNGTVDTAMSDTIKLYPPDDGFGGYRINAAALQKDGKIILVGGFTTFAGASRGGIIRLNANGTVDSTFNSGVGFDNEASDIRIDKWGYIFVCGQFSQYSGVARNAIVKIDPNGRVL